MSSLESPKNSIDTGVQYNFCVHTAVSAGSSWLLYVERHNMVTMVTYVEDQTRNGLDDIMRNRFFSSR